MQVLSRVIDRVLRLPPAVTRDVAVRRGLRVPMRDGIGLVADLYVPRRVPNAPTVLIRTPYGRGGLLTLATARPFAERGFQVLVQACRGTGGSGGEFDPFGRERADGLDTLDWIERQPWFHGRLLTFGPSYLGYVQWAMAPDAGDRITAMSALVTASQFRDQTYLGDAYTLRGTLSWTTLMAAAHDEHTHGSRLLGPLRGVARNRRLRAALDHLPLAEADQVATGRRVGFFQEWLTHTEAGDPYWVPERDHRERVGQVTAPVHLLGGWYDLFLDAQLEDYAALRAAGRRPHLTIGPWTHSDPQGIGAAVREALTWFRAHVTGDDRQLPTDPVRLYVQGAGEWRGFAEWPPPAAPSAWHLHAGGRLAPAAPAPSDPDRFRYDPADPTPGIGGPLLGPGAGRKDNAALEARADVLVYTSAPLEAPVEVIGPVGARIHLRSSVAHMDVYVRVCDVDLAGRSWNVCDGLQRITPERGSTPGPDGVHEVRVRLWPTAYRFAAGHRIRVQVAGGSHPRFARNTGTGEPLATATRLVAADQEVFHDPRHPSAVVLPLGSVPVSGNIR